MLSGQKGITGYQSKGANWLSGQKGITGYQGKGTKWLSEQKGQNWLSGTRDQVAFSFVPPTHHILVLPDF